ncbi:acyl-CoA dehydrogenase family protein [Bordetella sp. BOR01]|uniref:acyl-CoA dehydrogenase family protein n=1 Tax=Bordetella sp. BOR01 TaxID=2854779 RepID=UPI001C45571F|nr:acyl-CoA dehydrogenase family protein [Bordetella sp. BOR01]MBV7484869.1 acyl-CoA dehydrogenase family protein [Bordetella sp. BOR01]
MTAFKLNDDQRQIQDLVRRIAQEKVAPRANDIDRTGEYPQDMFELLCNLGLFALPFPPEHGGAGSLVSACLAIEELGRVCYNTAYLLAVQWTPFGAILAGGTAEQKNRWLPDLATGKARASISVTETQSGSDVGGIRTRARRVPDGYTLSGSKVWCTGASVSDYIFVAAKTGEDNTRAGINLFRVPREASGLQIGRKEEKTGARGVPSHPLFLDDVFVPADDCLGAEHGGFKLVMEAFNTARPIHAARGVALAQGAIDHAVAFIKNRSAFGQPAENFQGLRWMLADMAIQTDAARALVYSVAQSVDDGVSGKALAPMAAAAKCFATDVAMKVATDAVQLFGAAGITTDYPINRYMRDAKVLQIIEGTNQIQRNIVANALLGRAG